MLQVGDRVYVHDDLRGIAESIGHDLELMEPYTIIGIEEVPEANCLACVGHSYFVTVRDSLDLSEYTLSMAYFEGLQPYEHSMECLMDQADFYDYFRELFE